MGLQDEIDKMRSEIRTDDYAMSIGEWISLYQNAEIDIHPEFQRFFRWNNYQKTRLIESILLGIPIPIIFVAQREDGIWDVVDGLQRLSTIFQFVGLLHDEAGKAVDPLILDSTDYLPSLAGKVWHDPQNPERSLTQVQRLQIKRAKLSVSIILKESDQRSKYDLFQRLNTGGALLSDQEVRNCVAVMIDRTFFQFMQDLSKNVDFRETVALTDRSIEQQFDMELVLRFLVFRRLDEQSLFRRGDLSKFLYDNMIILAEDKSYDRRAEEEAFRSTFSILASALGSDSFRRYDSARKRFTGGFLISAFEVVALGLAYNYEKWISRGDEIVNAVKELWSNDEFRDASGAGVRASTRIPRVIPLGRRLFM